MLRKKKKKNFKSLLQSKKRLKLTASHLSYLENGKRKVFLQAKELLATPDSIIETNLNKHLVLIDLKFKQKDTTFVIVESLPQSKMMISLDNQTTLDPFILNILLLRMLVQESILLEKDYKPFWNTQCKEVSEKLWLPTEIDYVDSDSNLLNSSFKKEAGVLQSSIVSCINPKKMNSQKTCLKSSMYSTAEKCVKEDTVTKNHKIKIYPNQNQKQILKEWFGTSRYVYNRAVAYSKNPNSSHDLSILFDKYHVTDKYTMRNLFVTKKGSENSLNEWEFHTPKDIRAGSINEFTTSLKTNMSRVATGKISHFKLQFKSHKAKKTESISLKRSKKIKHSL